MRRLVLLFALLFTSGLVAQEGTPAPAPACGICADKTAIACPSCDGKGVQEKTCSQCDGKKKRACSHCAGGEKPGYIDCLNKKCVDGKVTWGNTGLFGQPTTDKKNRKVDKCKVCSGKGRLDCRMCRGGKHACECAKQNGRIAELCYDCAGVGRIDCPGCKLEPGKCNRCDAKGRHPCARCAGPDKAKKDAKAPKVILCWRCRSTQFVPCKWCRTTTMVACGNCAGTGKQRFQSQSSPYGTGSGRNDGGTKKCDVCSGKGRRDCRDCKGSKRKGHQACDLCDTSKCGRCLGGTVPCSIRSRGGMERMALLLEKQQQPKRALEFVQKALFLCSEERKFLKEFVELDAILIARGELAPSGDRSKQLNQAEARLRAQATRLEAAIAKPAK